MIFFNKKEYPITCLRKNLKVNKNSKVIIDEDIKTSPKFWDHQNKK